MIVATGTTPDKSTRSKSNWTASTRPRDSSRRYARQFRGRDAGPFPHNLAGGGADAPRNERPRYGASLWRVRAHAVYLAGEARLPLFRDANGQNRVPRRSGSEVAGAASENSKGGCVMASISNDGGR